jgi:hypothetical protein
MNTCKSFISLPMSDPESQAARVALIKYMRLTCPTSVHYVSQDVTVHTHVRICDRWGRQSRTLVHGGCEVRRASAAVNEQFEKHVKYSSEHTVHKRNLCIHALHRRTLSRMRTMSLRDRSASSQGERKMPRLSRSNTGVRALTRAAPRAQTTRSPRAVHAQLSPFAPFAGPRLCASTPRLLRTPVPACPGGHASLISAAILRAPVSQHAQHRDARG